MCPVDPPLRVGPSIPAPAAASPTLALDRRIDPGSLKVGQEVSARVLSDRASGRFVALIDGRQVEVILPPGAKAGDTLRLTVTAEQPRLLLSGQAEARAGAGTSAAPGARGAAAAPAALAATLAAGAPASDVSVSAGGRALTRLVADLSAATAALPGAAPDAAGAQAARETPLVALPASARSELAGQLAGALARTFSGSGLFYEAHQAQWVAGERSLDALRQEPQGKLPPLPAPAAAAAEPESARAAAPGVAEGVRASLPMMREPGSALPLPGTPAQGAGALAGIVDPAAASLVQQQLATLDAGSAAWSGLVLPGMPARIAVQERRGSPGEEADPGAEPGADWSTTLSVTLPRLGTIDARLLLRGERLMLSVAAGEATGARALAAARQQLLDALAGAGLKVDALQVEGP